MKNEEFYIGWSDEMPERNRVVIKRFIILLGILIPLLAFIAIYFSKPFNDHQFEVFNVKEFSGTYFEQPFPILILDKDLDFEGFNKNVLLVGHGKTGAVGIMQLIENKNGPLSGKKIKINGTLIYGDGKVLIELTNKENSLIEISEHGSEESFPSKETTIQANGEILDPKCWFGVMKPGEGKVHKSCAIRCISGGIQPVLRVDTNAGRQYYVLKGENGEDINNKILEYIAEPVSITGKTFIQNGWNILKINPNTIEYSQHSY